MGSDGDNHLGRGLSRHFPSIRQIIPGSAMRVSLIKVASLPPHGVRHLKMRGQ